MRITKTSAAEVAGKLSPWAKKILLAISGTGTLKVNPAEVAQYHNGVIELIAHRCMRADINLLTGDAVTILERGGKLVADILKAGRDK